MLPAAITGLAQTAVLRCLRMATAMLCGPAAAQLTGKKILSRRRPACLPLWLPALGLTLAMQAHAAEWSAQPEVSLESGYNDNIRLNTGNHDPVWVTILTPSVRFGATRERDGIYGNAGVAIRRYYGGSGRESSSILDRETYRLGTGAFYNTLRNAFRFDANFLRDNTLDYEYDENGDIVNLSATRKRWLLRPSWIRSLDERTRLSLGAQYSTVSFSDEPPKSDLIPYDSYSVTGSLSRQFYPRLQGTLATAYSKYEPDTGFNSETVSVQAGLSGNVSQTVTASILAGQRQTTSDTLVRTGFCVGADPGAGFPECTGGIEAQTGVVEDQIKNNGSVYSASITKTLETASMSATISRATHPSNQGGLLDTTKVLLTGNYHFTEKLTAGLGIRYYENETIVNPGGRQPSQTNQTSKAKKKSLWVTPKISWHWRHDLVIGAKYQYAEKENEDSAKANSNAIYLTLNYRPTKMYISR